MSAISSLDSLHGTAAFVATVESGSFAAAGRKLGLSASAIGKAVSRLEGRLGVKLLQRTTRSLALTAEGETLYVQAARVLEGLREAEATISRAQTIPQGRLKISMPTVIGRRLVVPALPRFIAAYPQVELNLWLDDRKIDLVEEGYDLVLRMGPLEDSRLAARTIGPHRFVTCASPGYLAARGIPRTPAELVDHACIHFRFPTTGRVEQWMFAGGTAISPGKGMTLNDNEALVAAAVAGLGVIQVPDYATVDAIAAGTLQVILPGLTQPRGDISLVWQPSRAMVPRTRAFADFMIELLRDCAR